MVGCLAIVGLSRERLVVRLMLPCSMTHHLCGIPRVIGAAKANGCWSQRRLSCTVSNCNIPFIKHDGMELTIGCKVLVLELL